MKSQRKQGVEKTPEIDLRGLCCVVLCCVCFLYSRYRKSLRKYKMHQFVVGPIDGALERKPLFLFNDRSDLIAEKALA